MFNGSEFLFVLRRKSLRTELYRSICVGKINIRKVRDPQVQKPRPENLNIIKST